MPRNSSFNSPFLLGFERLEQMLDSASRGTGDGFPPYNIEELPDGRLRISLAVAGFTQDDIDIQLEARQLVIRGRQEDDSDDRTFLHRGIAARQFMRKFVLADGIEVADAFMENGLLNIDLTRPAEETPTRSIPIRR
ncbi:Hsp20 family protein [Gimibacter soli]|uniref:Hsp20 family protein n=1 Tax=Gimibacter soli TaxID=3024400 RepID=A0AAE9XR91_9PROT|nr:Hsp20 family protein [Gimibacter soli]WCL54709.1 Hsp20 family protein [Gimibacter soli]